MKERECSAEQSEGVKDAERHMVHYILRVSDRDVGSHCRSRRSP